MEDWKEYLQVLITVLLTAAVAFALGVKTGILRFG